MDAAGGRTHPLRCFAIRVLSSASCRWRNDFSPRYKSTCRSRSERMPRERIAKHLSERVPTAGSIHVNTYTTTLVVDGTKTGYNTPTICVMIFGTTKTF